MMREPKWRMMGESFNFMTKARPLCQDEEAKFRVRGGPQAQCAALVGVQRKKQRLGGCKRSIAMIRTSRISHIAEVQEPPPFTIVSERGPLSFSLDKSGVTSEPASGGLASALGAIAAKYPARWI